MFTNICQNFLIADDNLRKEFDLLFDVIRNNQIDEQEVKDFHHELINSASLSSVGGSEKPKTSTLNPKQ